MRLLGLIFDFNGVLVDDEPLHLDAFQRAFREVGLDLSTEQYYERYLAFDDHTMVSAFLTDSKERSDPQRVQKLVDLKSSHYIKAIDKDIPLIRASVDFVRSLPGDVPLAVASAAARVEIEHILARIELDSRFTTIVGAEDVTNGKPHPEAFVKALEGLRGQEPGLNKNQVLVIEDSYRGIQSVKAAGLMCLALTTSYPAERLAEADLVVDSLKGWTLSRLAERLA